MLDNEFDQMFRDRLLNHSSRIKASLWKGVHTHLLRNKAFHFWKWYFVGPSAVVVAITGHVILAHLGHVSHKTAAHAVATYGSRPAGTAASTPITAEAATALTADTMTATTTAEEKTSPITASAKAAAKPIAPTALTPTAAATAASATTASTATTAAHDHHLTVRNDISLNQRPNHHSRTRSSANHSSGLTSAHPITDPGEENNVDAPRPPIPAQTTAIIAVKKLKTPAIVLAKTPNPKTPHQLILPAIPARSSGKLHLDVFGSPEYFTFKSFGLSYGAGARVTLVFKEHFTLTTGFQYLRINANHLSSKDSVNGLLPGYFNNVHIPLLIGYTTGNNRYSFSANAGLIFSLYAQANGELKTTDNWPTHIGPNFYLGLNFSTHVTDRVSLFAEPYLKCWYPPGNLRLPAQLWSTGLMVGLRYNF